MLDMKKRELKVIYDSRKSFYKKANIEILSEWNELHATIKKINLYSYNTLVCSIEYIGTTEERFYFLYNRDMISCTTLRHIKEFLQQLFYCRGKDLTKKDILKNSAIKYNVVTDEFIPLPF